MTDNQGEREGRPYNTTMPPTNPVYCTGGPRGRPGLRLHGCPDPSGHPKSLDFARLLEYHRHRLVTDVTIITSKDREFQFMHDREAMRWLQLTYKVPSEPSQKRVWVWRRLQNLGAFALQNSVYLLPFSDEVEKQFRQLVQEIREMGGEASIFLVEALDAADEKRILQVVTEARNNEYLTVVKVCKRFLAKALAVVESQGWNDQLHAEFAEVLEKVHVLFRTAKRHDMLGSLTASGRADAAEALSACEQVFRMLLDQEYLKARRILEQHSDLLPDEQSAQEQAGENGRMSASLPAQSEHHQVSAVGDEPGLPELPI